MVNSSGVRMSSNVNHQYKGTTKDVPTNKSARALLEDAFHLKQHDNLPNTLHNKLVEPQESFCTDMGDSERDHINRILQNVLNNPNLSTEEKEKVSKSILEGNYEIRNVPMDEDGIVRRPPTSGGIPFVHKRAPQTTPGNEYRQSLTQENKLYMSRFNLPKPHFLEVVTQSADIPIVNLKDARKTRIDTIRMQSASLRSLSPQNTQTWEASTHTATVDNNQFSNNNTLQRPTTMMSMSASQKLPSSSSRRGGGGYKENIAKIIAEERKKRLAQTRMELQHERDQLKKQKEYAQLSADKRLELKKQINEFRQKLKDYLLQIKDPKRGEIMRCVDDSLIYYFLETYHGQTLTPQTVLSLLSNTMGTSIIHSTDPDTTGDMETNMMINTTGANFNTNLNKDANGGGYTDEEEEGDEMGNGWQYLTETPGMPTTTTTPVQTTTQSKPNPNMSGSMSSKLNYIALKRNYKAFGQRSPPKLTEFYLTDNPHYLQHLNANATTATTGSRRPHTTTTNSSSRPNSHDTAWEIDMYNDGQYVDTNAAMTKRFHATRMNDAVEGYLPRPSDFFYNLIHPDTPVALPDQHSQGNGINGSNKVTLGSGFRTRALSPLQGGGAVGSGGNEFPHNMQTNASIYNSIFDHSQKGLSQPNNPSLSRTLPARLPDNTSSTRPALVVLSSEHLHSVAKTMGLSLTTKEEEELFRSEYAYFTANKGVHLRGIQTAPITSNHHQQQQSASSPDETMNKSNMIYEDSYLSTTHHNNTHQSHNILFPSPSFPQDSFNNNSILDDAASVNSLNMNASNVAISIMHESLLEEGILPSLRPDKILTDSQIEQLGLHKKTLDEILQEMGHQTKGGIRPISQGSKKNITFDDELATRNSSLRSSTSALPETSTSPSRHVSVIVSAPQEMHSPVTTSIKKVNNLHEVSQAMEQLQALSIQQHQQQVHENAEDEVPPQLQAQEEGQVGQGTAASGVMSMNDSYLSSPYSPHNNTRAISTPKDDTAHLNNPYLATSNIANANSFHLQPIVTANPALLTNPVLFYGSNLPTQEHHKARLHDLASNEQERAIKRLLLPAARDPNEKFKEWIKEFPDLMQPPTGKHNKKKHQERNNETLQMHQNENGTLARNNTMATINNTEHFLATVGSIAAAAEEAEAIKPRSANSANRNLRELSRSIVLPEPVVQKGPMALKTQTVYEERNGMTNLPVNPYKSWEEEMKVSYSGVPSGAGLLLCRPRDRANALGRYRASRGGANPRGKLTEQKKLPFVSMT